MLAGELLHRVQAALDLLPVDQRLLDPRAQQAAAHGRGRLVHQRQQASLALAAADGLGQFQVAAGVAVQQHRLCALIDAQPGDVLQGVLLRVSEVAHQRARRAGRRFVFLAQAQGGQVAQVEVTAEGLGGVGQLIPRAGLLGGAGDFPAHALAQLHHVADDDLHRRDAGQLVRQGIRGIRHLMHEELARGHVREGQTRPIRREAHGEQEVVRLLVQHGAFDHRAGGDDAGDAPLHQALGQRGILHLLADGDLVALGDEPLHIGIHGMMGHAAHGRALLKAAVAPGQRQLQLAGHESRVIEEHLIKVAQAEKEDAVLVLRLHLQILLHHRCQASHGVPHFVRFSDELGIRNDEFGL